MLLQLHWSMSWRVATLDPEGSTAKGLRVSTEIYFDPLMIPIWAGLWGPGGWPLPSSLDHRCPQTGAISNQYTPWSQLNKTKATNPSSECFGAQSRGAQGAKAMWGVLLGMLGLLMFLGGRVSLLQPKRGGIQPEGPGGLRPRRKTRRPGRGLGAGLQGCECRFRISKFWSKVQ